ncbi:MAG: dephospho-CoA kinase [Desulfovibrionaceae bacterium]|nr:dephospho-CoA kinase [Desulfovibrionaceae bacterium]MBF0513321.1 dephospho-CoA kinase [Desulfovibrionaceae bacterium]
MTQAHHAAPGDTLAITAPAQAAGMRLDAFLAERLAGSGRARSEIQKWIKDGLVLVDGAAAAKTSLKLRGGEELRLSVPAAVARLAPEEGELDILYADDALLVIDKPAGLTVHPAPGRTSGTLAHRLLGRFPQLRDMDSPRPGVVHRLDKDTSGVMLAALTNAARLRLSADFAERRVDKSYLALVHGRPRPDKGRINADIGRDPEHPTKMAVVRKGGREAVSVYQRLWSDPYDRFSLLHVAIFTGRTHQIRVHLAHLGHPVVGDATYGSQQRAILKREEKLLAKLARRQLLHAWRIAVDHPETGQRLTFTAAPPRDMTGFTRLAARRLQKVVLTGLPGSGKSEALRRLGRAGFPVFSADDAVAALYAHGADGWVMLRRRYGERFTPGQDADGAPVDKKALLAAMLESPALRREVEDLIHPLVRHALDRFWLENKNARAAFAEAPLYFEAGWQDMDAGAVTVFVDADHASRLARLENRGLSREVAAALNAWQLPPETKRARCDLALDNSGPLTALDAAAAGLLAALRLRRTQAARAFVFPLPA